MKTLVQYIFEEVTTKLPWNGDPKIGWWLDQDYLMLYHGTHLKNIESINNVGISRKDQDTGMISMAFEPDTAFGYASMSGGGGEAEFLDSGESKTTAPKDRIILVALVPMDWIQQNYDKGLGGNINLQKLRLTNEKEYRDSKSKGMSDLEYYQLCELRFKQAIPPNFIQGYMVKTS